MWLVFILLAALFILSIFMRRVFYQLPLFELKRRARSGDERASWIYHIASQGQMLDIFLICISTVTGTALVLWSAKFAWWAGVLAIFIGTWMIFWLPQPKYGGWLWVVGAYISRYSPVLHRLYLIRPLLEGISRLMPPSVRPHIHTGLYDKEDLLDLLNTQNHQVDNRVPEEELRMAFGALTFGDKKISELMTSRKKIHFVLADDVVGPTLMDELHKSGQVRFPVVKQIKKNIEPEIIGTLLLADIIGLDKKGPVSGVMRKGVFYINEEDDLRACLDAFTKTKAHLLTVVNNFEEIAGVIGLEDVLAEIIGKPLEVDFSDYHDKTAVAGKHLPKS